MFSLGCLHQYRRLAKKYHPDKNQGKAAKSKFLRIQEAYEVLSDEGKMQEWERAQMGGGMGFGGHGWGGGRGGGATYYDPFTGTFRFAGGGGGGGHRQQQQQHWQRQRQQQQQQQQQQRQPPQPPPLQFHSELWDFDTLLEQVRGRRAKPLAVILFVDKPQNLRGRQKRIENTREWVKSFEAVAVNLKKMEIDAAHVDVSGISDLVRQRVLPHVVHDTGMSPHLFRSQSAWEEHLPTVAVYSPDCHELKCGAILRPRKTFSGLREVTKKQIESHIADKTYLPELEFVTAAGLKEMAESLRRWETLVVAVSKNAGGSSLVLRHVNKMSGSHIRIVKAVYRKSDADFWSSYARVKSAPSVVFFTDGQAEPASHLTEMKILKDVDAFMEAIVEKSKARVPSLHTSTAQSHFRRCAAPRICILALGQLGHSGGALESLLGGLFRALDSSKSRGAGPDDRLTLEKRHSDFYKMWKSGRYKMGWVNSGTQKKFLKHLNVKVPAGRVAVIALQTSQKPPDFSVTHRSEVVMLPGHSAALLLQAIDGLKLDVEMGGNALRHLEDISPPAGEAFSQKVEAGRRWAKSVAGPLLDDVLEFVFENGPLLATMAVVVGFTLLPYLWVYIVADEEKEDEQIQRDLDAAMRAEVAKVRTSRRGDVLTLDSGSELGSRGLFLAVLILPPELDASSVETVDSVEAVEGIRAHAVKTAASLAGAFRTERRLQFALLDLGLQPTWQGLADRLARAALEKYPEDAAEDEAAAPPLGATLAVWKPGRKGVANLGYVSSRDTTAPVEALVNRVERVLEGLEAFVAAKLPGLE